MKLTWICAGLGCGLAMPVMAQSNLFIGWHVQAGSGYQAVTPSLTNYSSSGAYTNSQSSKGMPLVIGGGYTFALSERQVMGFSYERNLLSLGPAGQDYYTSSGLTSSTRM